MGIKEQILEQNKNLNATFEEEAHTYTAKGKELTSVTRFKHKFFPFNAQEVAKKLEIYSKGKKTKAEYLKEWHESAVFGTHIHKLIEDYINGEILTPSEMDEIKHARDFLDKEGFTNIATEIRLYSPSLGLAGTIDWIAEDKQGRLWVIDWKTTKTITEKNPYEKAVYPLNHLDNAKSLGFAFQTTVYKFILDNEYLKNKKIHGIMIVQLNLDNTYNIYSSENNKLPILEKEVVTALFD